MTNLSIIPEFAHQVSEFASIGREIASDKNICFISLARNCASYLEDRLTIVSRLGQKFKNYHWLIYENDSTDDTKKILSNVNSTNIMVVSEQLNSTHPCGPKYKSKDRTKALANYRNKTKELAKKHFPNVDYVIPIDLDFRGLLEDGLFNSIFWMDKNIDIDAMAGFSIEIHANNQLTNYDSWAYRHTWWSDQQHTMIWYFNWIPLIGSHPYLVNSAFGGQCIYKSNFYYGDCDYEGYDCEHVCFHKNLYNKYPDFSLYVNPSQIMFM